MSSFPKISIVTPNYNGAKYLEDTILSVLSQNYPNLEYIIIDGGSSDGSLDIIRKYEKKLVWWISEPDHGMYHAIQKGFDRSTGEIMAWINSDDMYHRNAFYSVAEIFDSFKQVNWLVGENTFYDEYGRTVFCNESRFFSKYDFYNYDFRWIQQESVFWRRCLWDRAGSSLNIDLKYAGDFDLWLRFIQIDRLFVTTALIGGFRFRRNNQLSLDHMKEYLQEAELEIKKINLSKKERRVFTTYKRLHKFISIIKKIKIFRTDWMVNRYSSKHLLKVSRIGYDWHQMKFILLD